MLYSTLNGYRYGEKFWYIMDSPLSLSQDFVNNLTDLFKYSLTSSAPLWVYCVRGNACSCPSSETKVVSDILLDEASASSFPYSSLYSTMDSMVSRIIVHTQKHKLEDMQCMMPKRAKGMFLLIITCKLKKNVIGTPKFPCYSKEMISQTDEKFELVCVNQI